MEDILTRILNLSVDHWNQRFCGVSGLDLSEKIGEPHEIVLAALEDMETHGAGSLNRNVTLHPLIISIGLEQKTSCVESEPVVTHMFFPSPSVLKEHFYRSQLARSDLPEYNCRLHKGGHPIELIFFSIKVMERYLSRPDLYEVYDTQAGGTILTKDSASDDDYVYVRHGKRLLKDGNVAVTAVLKDLSGMPPGQQSFWHSHEIEHPEFAELDPEFRTFVRQTFGGEFRESANLIGELSSALGQLNSALKTEPLYRTLSNPHLILPVTATFKSLCDSCSELFKLLGPDNLNTNTLKDILIQYLGSTQSDFVHPESGRHLSPLQLLKLLETRLSNSTPFSALIEKVRDYRVNDVHRIVDQVTESPENLSIFIDLLFQVNSALKDLANRLRSLIHAEEG